MQDNNQTFYGAVPTWANACVGDNGNPQQYEYAEGFAAAANLLAKSVIADEGMKLYVDDFIYPICFNMRHAVELFLKAVVEQLKALSMYRARLPEFDSNSSHDLGRIWRFVQDHAVSTDQRYAPLIQLLDQYIADIAAVDATGQVFRYPYSNENQKHLVDVAVINVIVLYRRFRDLQKLLKSLYVLGEELVSEYSWGSHTAKLSRDELFSIALSFPMRTDWANDIFTDRQKTVMDEFGLGKNDFSKALTLIQKNHEMAALIGAPLKLEHVDEQILIDFFDSWAKLHDLEKVRNPPPPELFKSAGSDMCDWLIHSGEIRSECWEKMHAYVTPGKLAELTSLYYFGNELHYSEAFVRSRTLALQEFSANNSPTGDRGKKGLYHILNKTNAVENILNSLNFLGQRDLVSMLLDRLQLQDAASRLLEQSIAGSWLTQRLRMTDLIAR